MTQATILLVEDNPSILKANAGALSLRGYRVLQAADIAGAWAHIARETPDLMILDVLLPDGSGFDFCREVRGRMAVPVLFLTALNQVPDVLTGYDAGADDYLSKPYDLDILLAKVSALLRLSGSRRSLGTLAPLRLGALTLDPLASRAFMRDEDMLLTGKEFALLLYLAEHRSARVSAEALYEAVWKQPFMGDSGALWKHLSNLKKKLDSYGDGLQLSTARGEGYRLEIME